MFFLLKFFSYLQDSSKYSSRVNKARLFLGSLIPTVSFQKLEDCFKLSNYNWYHVHASQLFQLSGKIQLFHFHFLLFLLCYSLEQKNSLNNKFIFFCELILGLFFWAGLRGPFVSQNHREFHVSHFSKTDSVKMVKYSYLSQWPFPPIHISSCLTFETVSCDIT